MITKPKWRLAVAIPALILGAGASLLLLFWISHLLVLAIIFWPLWWAMAIVFATVAAAACVLSAYCMGIAWFTGWVFSGR